MRSRSSWLAATFALLLTSACTDEKTDSPAKASPQDQAPSIVTPPGAEEALELRRMVQEPRADLSRMIRLLSGNLEERRWAVLALGLGCRRDPERVLPHLISAASLWTAGETPPSDSQLKGIGWAIGNCANREAEEVLRSWLAPDPTTHLEDLIDAGSQGLGALADQGMALSERTQTAVLDAAGREKRAELLLPLSRVGRLSEAVGAHLLEVVGALLTQKRKEGRREAIFALGNAGPSAVDPLAQILLQGTYDPQERAAAAQSLGRLGIPGQRALDKTISELLERGLPVEFDRPLWVPLRAALKTLDEADLARPYLDKIGSVVLSEGKEREKVAQRKRMVWLRCRAADLLSGDDFKSSAINKCDPKKGLDYSLARLKALSRGKITGDRLKEYKELLGHDDLRVSQAALRLLPAHREIKDTSSILLSALKSEHAGTRTAAAQIIAAYPARAFASSAEGPSEEMQELLKSMLAADGKLPAENQSAALKAAGALRSLTLKPSVEALCDGNNSALWASAAQALSLLGSPKRTCPKKLPSEKQARSQQAPQPTTLVIDSDVGELLLHLEPGAAPLSSAHFLGLVDSGHYDGLSVHGERLGFAVQFGDKNEDGYDDKSAPGLPNEVSPDPFASFDFGMTSFAPGKHNSHLFVVVSDAPQLTGRKIRLGRAEGPWQQLVVGDTLYSVKRK